MVLLNLAYIAKLMLRPQYTFVDACRQVRAQVLADHTVNPMVIGHGSLESAFYTQLPSLDDLGAQPVLDKFAEYHPGWLLAYNSDAAAFIDTPGLQEKYRFQQVGNYPVFDQKYRNRLLLYRIEPRP